MLFQTFNPISLVLIGTKADAAVINKFGKFLKYH